MIDEARTEAAIDSAVQHAKAGDRELWIAAYQANKVYGLYQDNATNEIAKRAGRSISTVKNWVNAYRCFSSCLALEYELTRWSRRELSITHFRIMYEMAQRYSLPPSAQLVHFYTILGYKRTGSPYSVEILKQEIEATKPEQKAVDWHYWFERVRNPLEKLASFDGELPPEIKRRVVELLALFDERYYDVV